MFFYRKAKCLGTEFKYRRNWKKGLKGIKIVGVKAIDTDAVVIPEEINGKEVTEIGKHAFFWSDGIKSVFVPRTVKAIGKHAFFGMTSLKVLHIAASIEEIPTDMVRWCSCLTTVVLPDTVKVIRKNAFNNNSWLEEITLPDSVQVIEDYAFSGCSELKKIYFPESVQVIGKYVLDYCNKIQEISVCITTKIDGAFSEEQMKCIKRYSPKEKEPEPGKLKTCDWKNFETIEEDGNITITGVKNRGYINLLKIPVAINGKLVTKIADKAFRHHKEIIELHIPKTIKHIGKEAFSGCINMKKIHFDGTVDVFDDKCFQDCEKLQKISFSKDTKYIGHEAFYGCKQLGEYEEEEPTAKILLGLETEIEDDAFEVTQMLNTVYVSEDGYMYAVGCEADVQLSSVKKEDLSIIFTGVSNLDMICVMIPEQVRSMDVVQIGAGALSGCKLLQMVIMPDTIKYIAEEAFIGCTSLKKLQLPDSLIQIGRGAFSQTGLEEISIPDGVKVLEDYLFAGCQSLELVYMPRGWKQVKHDFLTGSKPGMIMASKEMFDDDNFFFEDE